IVALVPGATLPSDFKRFSVNRNLEIIYGQVVDLPNGLIKQLESRPEVFRLHFDRPIRDFNYRTSITVGAVAARLTTGYTGAGVGIAVIDSGIVSHDDLTKGTASGSFPYGNLRVSKF